ncbi:type II secretion system protein GspG [Algibacter lectus]|nr:type II secretion system protein GspG [Algibacter lectus]
MRQNVIFDSWKQEFHYESLNNGTEFKLQSLGSDGELDTSDDVKHNK